MATVCCGQYTIPGVCQHCPMRPQSYFTVPTMGWECPRCHKINAPTVTQCNCPVQFMGSYTVGAGSDRGRDG